MRDAVRFLGSLLIRWAGPGKQACAPRESHEAWVARLERKRAEKDAARKADIDRLKQLGGRPRSPDEEAEFLELLVRNNASAKYFESRIWERKAA